MDQVINIVFRIIMTIVGLLVGAIFGIPIERAHYRNLEEREQKIRRFPITDLKSVPGGIEVSGARMVIGQVVVGSDYLKTFLSKLRNIFGGEMISFQRVMDRARREALLRAVEQAQSLGACALINVRYDTSRIGSMQQKGGVPMAEVVCSGTALFGPDQRARIVGAGDAQAAWQVSSADEVATLVDPRDQAAG
ncbi:MAG: heavy metal-binding domain-containing protein [Planctomycetes bacterium]|nr:heavy metal-binding domain-containing protein [Planctomycetota bacterium]